MILRLLKQESNHISLHALEGKVTPTILKIKETAGKQSLLILIDSGNTRSYLATLIASEMKCKTITASPIIVASTSGHKLVSD
ncbi:conserved hypothetical protein [Ricinus communis]|uniref:Uncharacterized protein n=1 Tax=Ricinus communis TaxID=3988 RepID=B9SUY4_RICCO|nr:conserved hypothetical protein [Ricinus communis]